MTSNKILPVALVAALLGGTVGALVMRPGKSAETAQVAGVAAKAQPVEVADNKTASDNDMLEQELAEETKNLSDEEKALFREGFIEGVRASREAELTAPATRTAARSSAAPAATRVVYRNTARRASTRQAPRRVYYDYGQTKGRSFWQKHRDKLTVAIGTGAGAAIGGAIGGKKGALIGALSGAGGSALYTYKLRKRNRNY
ncbi:MAG TPA: hypothetical protein VD968_02840 [Pyrinomonadaceae bacterium]|nr:hypothetical protein [Pyrinomonadaceae bacterium]